MGSTLCNDPPKSPLFRGTSFFGIHKSFLFSEEPPFSGSLFDSFLRQDVTHVIEECLEGAPGRPTKVAPGPEILGGHCGTRGDLYIFPRRSIHFYLLK